MMNYENDSAGHLEVELDRHKLKELTHILQQPGVLFGKDYMLSSDDQQQLDAVAKRGNELLAPHLDDDNWKKFEALMQEGGNKGVLLSFTSHPGTNVPIWCVDGGSASSVKKILLEDEQPGIQVPSDVYNVFHYKNTLQNIEAYAHYSEETIKGQATKYLGEDLRQASYLFRESY